MGLATTLAIASGVKALGSYAYKRYKNNKRKKFGDTAYGQELKRIGEEGKYSQKAKGLIQGGQARATAGVAQTGKASYAGRLASQGLEGSVAGQRGMAEFDIARQRQMGETARDIELENEQAKAAAKLSYAEAKTQDTRERERLEREAGLELIDGLSDTAQAGINAYFGAKSLAQKMDALGQLEDADLIKMAENKLISMEDLTELLSRSK